MNTLRIILAWVIMILLWAAPFVARRRGKVFWQSGFVWKYLAYWVISLIGQLFLLFGAGWMLGFIGTLSAGTEPGIEMLYTFLVVFCAAEAGIVLLLMKKFAR